MIRELREIVDLAICLPATLLALAAPIASRAKTSRSAGKIAIRASGAHTGDISAEMLKDAGATYVIVGHSERRSDHGETDTLVRAKASAALRAGLTPIICVGETRPSANRASPLQSWPLRLPVPFHQACAPEHARPRL